MTTIVRARIAIAATAIVILLLLFVTGAVYCEATLHVPRKLGAAPPNAATVTIAAADKIILSAWLLRPPTPNGNCVVVLHGLADSRAGSAGFASMFLERGYTVLVPDSRGHGASEGRFVTYGLLEKYDVLAWASWLRSDGCYKLYALGESLGASVLIQATALQPVFTAIVAECPYADLRETAEYRLRQKLRFPAFLSAPAAKIVVGSGMLYARWIDGLDLAGVSPVRDIVYAATPILLIHGLEDTLTPPSNSQRLARANPRNQLWLVPHALHTGAASAAPGEFHTRVLAWFAGH